MSSTGNYVIRRNTPIGYSTPRALWVVADHSAKIGLFPNLMYALAVRLNRRRSLFTGSLSAVKLAISAPRCRADPMIGIQENAS